MHPHQTCGPSYINAQRLFHHAPRASEHLAKELRLSIELKHSTLGLRN